MSRRAVLAWVLAALLLVLHVLPLDAWRPRHAVPFFGWLPEELAYRLVWIGLASVYLLWFTAKVWREEDA